MKKCSLLFVFLSVSGCVGMPDMSAIGKSIYNLKESGISEFDGTKYVQVRNITCPSSNANAVMFDLYQSDEMSINGVVLLTLKAINANSIGSGQSLHFNIDGKIVNLKSIDEFSTQEKVFAAMSSSGYAGGGTYIAPTYSSAIYAATKRYHLTMPIIKMIGGAKRVAVRVDLTQKYIEGLCTIRPGSEIAYKDYPSMMDLVGVVGFKSFVKMTEKLKL